MKKKLEIIFVVLIVAGIIFFVMKYKKEYPTFINNDTEQIQNNIITITQEVISEDNFSGTRSIIAGSGILADSARNYINQTYTEFKKLADEDVPTRRLEFGEDAPPSTYTIDIKATYTKSLKTESIIIDEYIYTGGANGSSSYKVFTASNASGKILSLEDVIQADKQIAFTVFVKNQLLAWRPDSTSSQVVFKEEIEKLTFASFANWSFDNNNLIIYFDKYAIGPGALGAVAFPIKLSKLQNFLSPEYMAPNPTPVPVVDKVILNTGTVGVGQTKIINGLSITFNEFVQDSRCPIDVTCIQAGAVNINVTFKLGSNIKTLNMPSDEVPQEFAGYKIAIVDVLPKRLSNTEPSLNSYIITFRVDKM